MAGIKVIKFLGLYVLNQNEIGVSLTLGKYSGTVRPGLGFAFPLAQGVIKTTSSLQSMDLPDQQIVLSGNISVTISGTLNFRVSEPRLALLSVQDYRFSVRQLALTTISDVLGTKTIEEVRTTKGKIADEIEEIIGHRAAEWGLADVDVRLTDANMDESLLRAMMRETEARKEATALQIKAESDLNVARMFAEAATTLSASPGAMTLRVLQTLSDVSNDKSTVVVPIPLEMLGTLTANSAQTTPAQTTPPPAEAAGEASTASVAPPARIEFTKDKTTATCPHCQARYSVAKVLGDMRYDHLADVPGQQLKCKQCEGVFTLPGTE